MLGIAHGDLRLVCSCSAMETHFMKLPTNSSCADVASRGSLELNSECCNQGQTIVTCYTLQHLPIPFCELVWPTTSRQSRFTPRSFHFTITTLTVDWGSSSRAEILQTDLLERWHPMTVPLWKPLSSSVRSFDCQCLSMDIAWLCDRFYTPVSNRCGWNRLIH